ncbi:MAG: hypothetical protein HYZ24_05690 [Chloroflexi bacterium]|nr:hypothetical protein [Chloroflexota bacterium]
MNIQSFYEYVILRDILAFILPGSITLGGIYMVVEAYGFNRIEKYISFVSGINSAVSTIFFLLIAFLVGHIWDMVYRLRFQKTKQYQREDTYKKLLVGDPDASSDSVNNHIADQIKSAVGEFLEIDWKKNHIEKWIDSGKIFEASVLLSYWIEEEDPKLFGTEIGRPITQSHLLHTAGMAFLFLGCICIPLAAVFRFIGSDSFQLYGLITLVLFSLITIYFGQSLIKQGIHKREIFLEHVFRVFYVVWRKRTLANKLEIEKVKYAQKKIDK